MLCALHYTKQALKNLQSLSKVEAKRIIEKLEYFCTLSNPFVESKPLEGNYAGLFRFRIGKYRVIFTRNRNDEYTILTVLKIGKRDDIYK